MTVRAKNLRLDLRMHPIDVYHFGKIVGHYTNLAIAIQTIIASDQISMMDAKLVDRRDIKNDPIEYVYPFPRVEKDGSVTYMGLEIEKAKERIAMNSYSKESMKI